MSRRAAARTDSLELLLDTICNAFGGILFIALLVVILLQASGRQPATSPDDASPVDPAELQQLADQLDRLQQELAQLRDSRASVDAAMAQFAPDETQALLEARRQADLHRQSLEQQRDRTLHELAEKTAEVNLQQREIADARAAHAQAQAEVNDLESQLADIRRSRQETVRLPRVRDPGSTREVPVVLQYGRFYVWHQYSPLGSRQGLNTDEFVILENRPSGAVTTPRPTRGIPVVDAPESHAALKARLSAFSPQRDVIALVIRPDSFAHFAQVRDAMINLGFAYRAMPCEDEEPVYDRGGSGGRVQ